MRPYTQNRGCGNAGGDKPRPYGKTGSVGVGAAFMAARGAKPQPFPLHATTRAERLLRPCWILCLYFPLYALAAF